MTAIPFPPSPLWVPDRRLWVPGSARPPRRGTHRPRRPFARTFAMADGDVSLDADGNAMLTDDGDLSIACPPSQWMQAKLCSDASDVDAWFPYAEPGGVPTVTVNSTGYTLPAYAIKSGVKYYFAAGNNILTTPGTIATGYTTTTSCAACGACAANNAASYTVSFSGVTLRCCTYTDALGNPRSLQGTGSVNGTHTMTLFSCGASFSFSRTTAAVKSYGTTDCSGGVLSTTDLSISLSLGPTGNTPAVGGVSIFYTTPNGSSGFVFNAPIPIHTDCLDTVTVANTVAATCDGEGRNAGVGGTCTITAV